MILDDQSPSALSLTLPERITRGTKELPVRATVKPPPSRITEVAISFGPKAELRESRDRESHVKAQTGDPEGSNASATLPVPADAPAKLVVTARFTTGVGLIAFKSGEVDVIAHPSRRS